jgi:hypothetical protein
MDDLLSNDLSWRNVRAHPRLPPGSYATDIFDQHALSWCGCCYLVAVVQAVEDRGHILLGGERHRIDMQTVLDHMREDELGPTWNACHGGYPEHVVACMASGQCPLRTSVCRRWVGHAMPTHRTPLSDAPYHVMGHDELVCAADVARELVAHGPVVLDVCAQTLKAVDAQGRVTDMEERTLNHAVSVIGWKHVGGVLCWIVRNSWGKHRVPAALPDDLGCVTLHGNACEVQWEYWVGDPKDPGFVYLPVAHPGLHGTHPSPWLAPRVVRSQ